VVADGGAVPAQTYTLWRCADPGGLVGHPNLTHLTAATTAPGADIVEGQDGGGREVTPPTRRPRALAPMWAAHANQRQQQAAIVSRACSQRPSLLWGMASDGVGRSALPRPRLFSILPLAKHWSALACAVGWQDLDVSRPK